MTKKSTVIITGNVKNVGQKKTIPKNVNLYIDESIYNEDNNEYEFPYLLCHRNGSADCVLSKATNKSEPQYPFDKLSPPFSNRNELLQICIPLRHLSADTIRYIAPKENFSDDVALNIGKAGIYRAMMVFIPEEQEKNAIINPEKGANCM